MQAKACREPSARGAAGDKGTATKHSAKLACNLGMKVFPAILLALSLLAPLSVNASTLRAGLYRTASGSSIYVGPEHELPDPTDNQFFDPATQRFGDVAQPNGLTPERTIEEARRTVKTPFGPLGVSLYYADTRKRAAVILIHGNDPETREMGFLVPFFVLNGINVISYDQRGTGQSNGSWQLSGPAQRARDVDAIFDAYATDPMVDAKRIGMWGFSNGGWTAPIVATQRPIAFMLLKSAPAESIVDNLIYEVRQSMAEGRHSRADTAQALAAWHALLGALAGTGSWKTAERLYASAQAQHWFDDSLIPANLKFPLRGALADGYRSFVFYDPSAVLRRVKTPALALYGAKDRKVDVAHASKTIRANFLQAGMTDFTMHVYPDAMHSLLLTSDGFDAFTPKRFAPGYPNVMIDWLKQRGLLVP
jgi:pimeloyl-ACP methyl ester carboxylesterase